jgi:hypothetical protein
MSVSRR